MDFFNKVIQILDLIDSGNVEININQRKKNIFGLSISKDYIIFNANKEVVLSLLVIIKNIVPIRLSKDWKKYIPKINKYSSLLTKNNKTVIIKYENKELTKIGKDAKENLFLRFIGLRNVSISKLTALWLLINFLKFFIFKK